MNQIFRLSQNNTLFESSPPFDGFDNGSGYMDSVKYARNVIGFDSRLMRIADIPNNNFAALDQGVRQVIEHLAKGKPVGIVTSLLAGQLWGNYFQGRLQAGTLSGGHAMIITDIKNPGSSYGYSQVSPQTVS